MKRKLIEFDVFEQIKEGSLSKAESELIEVIRELDSIRINSRKCLGNCFEKYSDFYQKVLDEYWDR